jgi:hypothetical protein
MRCRRSVDVTSESLYEAAILGELLGSIRIARSAKSQGFNYFTFSSNRTRLGSQAAHRISPESGMLHRVTNPGGE